jgi:hypothetical protein
MIGKLAAAMTEEPAAAIPVSIPGFGLIKPVAGNAPLFSGLRHGTNTGTQIAYLVEVLSL